MYTRLVIVGSTPYSLVYSTLDSESDSLIELSLSPKQIDPVTSQSVTDSQSQ